MSKVPSDQKSQWVDLCTTFTLKLNGGQNLVSLITPVRKVVLTCRVVFFESECQATSDPEVKRSKVFCHTAFDAIDIRCGML